MFPPCRARNAAFAPTPVNDAILAEVNSQRLATAQIMPEAKSCRRRWRSLKSRCADQNQFAADVVAAYHDERMKQRLDALEAARAASIPFHDQRTAQRVGSLKTLCRRKRAGNAKHNKQPNSL